MIGQYAASPQRVFEQRRIAIESKRTAAGGYSRAQLADWNVNWPPKHGWKEALIDQDARAFRRFAMDPRRSMVDPLEQPS